MDEEVFSILGAAAGAEYLGEAVTQLEHALQAAHFAREAGGSDELVLAALLHDVGHLLPGVRHEGLGCVEHDEVGARWLRARGFSPVVCELVRGHVQAKRYLTFARQGYARRLSDASVRTLALQGGPMDAEEARRFEADPLHREKLKLRGIDEQAKRTDLSVAPLASYRDLVRGHLEARP